MTIHIYAYRYISHLYLYIVLHDEDTLSSGSKNVLSQLGVLERPISARHVRTSHLGSARKIAPSWLNVNARNVLDSALIKLYRVYLHLSLVSGFHRKPRNPSHVTTNYCRFIKMAPYILKTLERLIYRYMKTGQPLEYRHLWYVIVLEKCIKRVFYIID